ncbi:hypothetical protein G7Y89_g2317 [Cudoniella acicularis]|uniref:Transcription factor domain-containing protein n=1 Tax=Cudoniella acicularis TaxID=354080 RepID=A0A8H4RVJ5_9HELO|nr:hypothetical protein G7Y89_g2317 [Cudoniella acicularis]
MRLSKVLLAESPPFHLTPTSTSNDPPENAYQFGFGFGFDFEQDWASSYNMKPNPDFGASDFAAWDQEFYVDLMTNTSPGRLIPQAGLIPGSLDLQMSSASTIPHTNSTQLTSTDPTNNPTPSRPYPEPPNSHTSESMVGVEDSTEVPEHVLTQHYSLNAIHRLDSKNWNFYMHFYNRFATSHPPVLLAIYASVSSQLLYANKLGSMARAISYYDSCLSKLDATYGVILPHVSTSSTKESLIESLRKLNKENLDVVIISLYFLALFDLTTTRPAQLRRILRVMPTIIRSRSQSQLSGTFQRLSTWFIYLDTRASLFGLGDNDVVIYSTGDEAELHEAVSASQSVLQEEYSFLYPDEERTRDKLAVPLILRILDIMVIFREISRHTEPTDDNTIALIRQKINQRKKELDSIDEYSVKSKKLSIYYYTIIALYNAVEIYFSRTFQPNLPLYSCNEHATAILRTAEKLHRTTGKPQAVIPHSKAWPIPMIFAIIEVEDPIYRNWGLRKLHDYRRAGNHYVKSYNFIERVCTMEEINGARVNLGSVMKQMGEEFIV